jgi:hypothetical protein
MISFFPSSVRALGSLYGAAGRRAFLLHIKQRVHNDTREKSMGDDGLEPPTSSL